MLPLRDAWLVLGRTPGQVRDAIRAFADQAEGVRAQLVVARALAKKLLGLHHPDRNPGDEGAKERFKLVQEALESVEAGTEEFRPEVRRTRDGDVFIEVEGA